MTLANKLTMSRIFLAFVFIILLFSKGLFFKSLALAVFALASLTDLLDGIAAKRTNTVTDFGKLMDPIADKVLVLAAFVSFVQMRIIPAWMVVIIMFREFSITGLRLLAMSKGRVIAASGGGRHKTVSQFASIFVILIFLVIQEAGQKGILPWSAGAEAAWQGAITIFMFIAVIFTAISGASYLIKNKDIYLNGEKSAKFVSSMLYLGHSPFMPGTIGSLAGLVIYLLVKGNPILYGFTIIFIFALGIVFSTEAEKIYKRKDARAIVIDEACGMMLSLAFLPYKLWLVIAGFILFRFFDIIKPPPARALERLPGAWGIMIDDLIAAFYANLVLQFLLRILHLF